MSPLVALPTSLCLIAGCALVNARGGEDDRAAGDDVSEPDAGQVVEPGPGEDAGPGDQHVMIIGGDAVIDTYLDQEEPTFNYGAEEQFCTDSSGEDRRALLRFDLSAVPSPSIAAATLHIWTDGGDSGQSPDVHLLYQLLEPWHEGGGEGEAGVASWDEAQPGELWIAAGAGPGSRADTPVGSFTPLTAETRYDVAIDPDLVSAWVQGAADNHGLAIVNGGGDASCYDSSEVEEPAYRPSLTVVWTD